MTMDENDLLVAGKLPDDPTADCDEMHVGGRLKRGVGSTLGTTAAMAGARPELETNARGRTCMSRDNGILLGRWMLPEPLWLNTHDGRRYIGERELTDDMLLEWTVALSDEAGVEFTKEKVDEAFHFLALKNKRNPVQELVNSYIWDGVERITMMLVRYFGAEDTPLTRMMARKFMIGAASRVLNPGGKLDTMLVLVGEQGVGKSQASRILALMARWFLDTYLGMRDRDSRMALRGTVIIEMAELASLKGKGLETIKQFMTQQEDRYRLPYARLDQLVPRSCVFVGTTNNVDFLRDVTGNRRFWPVTVGTIDLEALRNDVEQLWAEAVVAYKAGETWWPDAAESEMLRDHHANYEVEDPLLEPIRVWTEDQEQFRMAELLEHGLEWCREEMKPHRQAHVGRLLRKLGWKRVRRKVGDRTPRVWIRSDA